MSTLVLSLGRFEGPLGTMLIVWDGLTQLRAIDFATHEARMRELLRRHYGVRTVPRESDNVPARFRDALTSYFDGRVCSFEGLALATNGTPFQKTVWTALGQIPPGTTTTYVALASMIGRPNASRAVGLANGANPLALVVPCHRVIGTNGSLTGYGGGLERKAWLLDHERRYTSGGRCTRNGARA